MFLYELVPGACLLKVFLTLLAWREFFLSNWFRWVDSLMVLSVFV